MQKYKGWLQQYYPAKAASMDMALTEYNIQVPENSTTADLEDGVWHANFIGAFIQSGGTIASAWDMNTTKVPDGGGHGMLDPNNDPTRPYAERAKYWAFKMMTNNFTGSLVPSVEQDTVKTDNPAVAVYAAKDRSRVTVMLINRDPNSPVQVNLQVSGASSATKLRMPRLSRKEYVWSKVLYRAVVNEDPTKKQVSYAAPAERQGWRVLAPVLEPMSLNVFVFE